MLRQLLLALAIVTATAAASLAQGENLREVKGVIRSLDLKSGSLTMQQLFSDQQPGFSLAKQDLPVLDALGKPAQLSDLRVGLRVAVKVRGDTDIVAIRVDGPYVHGIIKSVDPQARSITFKDYVGIKTFTIPVSSSITSQSEPATFSDCKAGSAIQFLFSLDKKTILNAQIGKGTHNRDPYLRVTRYYGILADVDQSKMQASVYVQSTDPGTVKEYTVAPDAYLRVMYSQKAVGEVPFASFAKWAKVYYFVDRDTGMIVNMDADLPVMTRRKVSKIDAKSITVEDEKKDKAINLASDVQVFTPKGEGNLADIGVGRIVNCALTLDRQRVRVIYLWDR